MRGLFLDGTSLTFRDDLPAPAPASGETVVRVLQAGVCATDLALQQGYMGFRGVPGHEFVGVATSGRFAGQRVVGDINAACRACATCRAGDPHHCPNRTVLGIVARGGAFADELALPDANLLPVPDAVPTDAATFVEPLAAAFEIAEQVELVPGQTALVAGDGRLGLLCAWVLHDAGLAVTVAGRHPERQDLLPEGVAHRTGLLDREAGADDRVDLVVEATGAPEVLQRALSRVRPRGTLVLKTTAARPTTVDLSPLVVDEITVVGSRCGPFDRALAALARGAVPVERLIAARYPLEQGVAAVTHAAEGGVLKVLIEVAQAPD